VAKNGRIDSVSTNRENPTRDGVKTIIEARGSIEVYHRELKQTCGIERGQARTGRAQRNPICLSIRAWLDKHRRRMIDNLSLYQQDWENIKIGISKGIKVIMAAG